MGSYDGSGKFNKETFKKRIEDIGGTVVLDDGNEIVVELDGYEAVIDAKTGEIKKFGKEVTLVVEATQGEVVGDEVTIEIEVKTDVDTVDSVTVTNLDTGKTYEASFSGKSGQVKVDSNGTYKIEVKATTEGSQRTGQATVTVDEIEIAFTKAYVGKIDIVWVDKENNIIEDPLPPVLNGMTPVYWDDQGEEHETTEGDSNWYEYEAGNNIEDSKNSHWANAINITENGNKGYFVWIPRYAYKITYLTSDGKLVGYRDGRGKIDAKGNVVDGEGSKTRNRDSFI